MLRCDFHPDRDAVSVVREAREDLFGADVDGGVSIHLCAWCTDHNDPTTEWLDHHDVPPAQHAEPDRLFSAPATMRGQLAMPGAE